MNEVAAVVRTAELGRAIVFNGSECRLEERTYPLPSTLAAGSVLVKTSMVTVCGSDINTRLGRRRFPIPSILGHEIVGTVIRCGEGVDRDAAGNPVAIGDRITFSLYVGCGTCADCLLRNLPQKCSSLFKYGHMRSDAPPHFTGGFAEYVVLVPRTCFFKVPALLSDAEVAPLMCAGATVSAGLEAVGFKQGERVLVQGVGMLGLYVGALAKSLGADFVMAVDRHEKRLNMARRFGVDATARLGGRGEAGDVEDLVRLAGGANIDLVVEATGDPSVVPAGIKMLANGGRYLFLGALYPGSTCALDTYAVIVKLLTIKGIHNYRGDHLGRILQFMSREHGKYPFGDLVAPPLPLSVEGVEEALRPLGDGEVVRRSIAP